MFGFNTAETVIGLILFGIPAAYLVYALGIYLIGIRGEVSRKRGRHHTDR